MQPKNRPGVLNKVDMQKKTEVFHPSENYFEWLEIIHQSKEKCEVDIQRSLYFVHSLSI